MVDFSTTCKTMKTHIIPNKIVEKWLHLVTRTLDFSKATIQKIKEKYKYHKT